MTAVAKLAVLGSGIAVALVVLAIRGDGPPALALRRESVARHTDSRMPMPLPADPSPLPAPATAPGPGPPVADTPRALPTEPADDIRTLTLDEAPPVPDLPALEIEPLAFTTFEPPYDDRRIPQAVALAARDFTRAERSRLDPDSESGRWLATQPPDALELYLASTTLDSGVQLWVHMTLMPEATFIKNGRALFFEPSTGLLGPQRLDLETHWGGWEPGSLPQKLGQADLDLDGRRELVVREHTHNGTDDSHTYLHMLEVDERLRPSRRFTTHEWMYVSWAGWDGQFQSRLIPVSAGELWAQAWYQPRNDGPPIALGHSVYLRAGAGAPYDLEYQVINPDAPARTGDGFASWIDADLRHLGVRLGPR